MPKDLSSLFYPKSVAIIGASRSPEKVGAIVLKNIVNSKFTGQIYPVNPNADKINDLQCFKDVNSLPEVPDLAIIVIPAMKVTEALSQAGEKGIKNVVVISAGFKETGEDGANLEKELVETCQKHNIRLLGPNCLGFVNNLCPINATFGQPVNDPGNIRFISQSGAIAASLFDWCQSTGLNFSEFITLGNKSILTENNILQYFLEKIPDTTAEGLSHVYPIGLYLESISSGTEFLKVASQISKNNPVFILKPGKTKAAIRAMQSHTGAIAGEDTILEAVLEQAGVTRCRTLEDFFDLSRAFAWEDCPVGPKVAVISNAGGPAVISADAIVSEGLELAEFDSQTKEQLAQVLPRAASIINPVDVLGDALSDRFVKATEIILETSDVNALVFILTPQIMTQIEKTAEIIGNISKKYKIPIFCSFIGGSLVTEGETILNKYKIPSFRYPERAIVAIGAMWRFRKQQSRQDTEGQDQPFVIQPNTGKIREVIDKAVSNNQKTLDNFAANEILSSVGISTPATQLVSDLDQAKNFIQNNGWPVVLKLSSPGLLHKKDIGGVVLDIMNDEQLEDAWHKLERKITQLDESARAYVVVQIQKDILDGVEVIVGAKHDPTFGPTLLFGAGGTYAEIISDTNIRLLPLELSQVKELVAKSKVYKVLKGHKDEHPYALDNLYDLITRFGKLIEHVPEASEIEINPVIVTLNNAWAVDGKVVLKEGEKKVVTPPKFKAATTIKHEILATTFHYFEFESEEPLEFQPGQYITVKVTRDAVRCYSIAGHKDPTKFNLLVDVKPGGPGSRFFSNLKVNDKITYLGPFGVFTLNLNDGAKNLLFLGTGSGCSPLRCMIDSALEEQNTQLPITLYIGLNYPQDIFWQDHLDYLSQKYSNFKYKIAIFKPDDTWQGHTGFITDLVKQDFPDASTSAAYLCGNKAMIESATEILLANGCPKERIYTEKL